MTANAFSRPIFVKDEGQAVREIACVADALAFLTTWPENRRGPIHSTAVRACQAAREGRLTVDGARNAFAGFARSVHIREAGPVSVEPWMVTPRRGRMPI
ncbi:DUF982 domain-containing protein [Aminobacter aganoensis]|uniref:DUF982 domain-containing protein n=1 Tax=Aminobacter aganoensis TaxID=83264 RepID=A0A7X0KLA0_9HYPH|nr:DUF982 domain-containing protein [Aminobacter aganoensis]MBB6354822.1 hypothetical protein [Aminobacter aganoensis]